MNTYATLSKNKLFIVYRRFLDGKLKQISETREWRWGWTYSIKRLPSFSDWGKNADVHSECALEEHILSCQTDIIIGWFGWACWSLITHVCAECNLRKYFSNQLLISIRLELNVFGTLRKIHNNYISHSNCHFVALWTLSKSSITALIFSFTKNVDLTSELINYIYLIDVMRKNANVVFSQMRLQVFPMNTPLKHQYLRKKLLLCLSRSVL